MRLDATTYSGGEIINGLTSVIWVERYMEPGEITITCPPDPYLQEKLAPGTLVSHIDSQTVMMIETHTIDESKEGEITLEMTGRTIDVIAMENRVLTMDDPTFLSFVNGLSEEDFTYNMVEDNAWAQAAKIINEFLVSSISNTYQTYPNLEVINAVNGTEYPQSPRAFPKGTTVAKAVYDLLGSTGKGLRLIRPTRAWESNKLAFYIHDGQNKSNQVLFDWAAGDVEKARYVWSNKVYRNSAYVHTDEYTYHIGKNLMVAWDSSLYLDGIDASGWDLRVMSVDASDWKLGLTPPLSDLQKAFIRAILNARGKAELAKQKKISMIDATISSTSRYEYIHDYNIGDIVRVRGNYGVEADMRVVEFAVTSDANGDVGFPTLEEYIPET